MSDHIKNYPILALRGLTIFPGIVMHFDVKREKSIDALNKAMNHGQKIFLTAQKKQETEDPVTMSEIYAYGTIARVKQIVKLPNKVIRVLVEGLDRGRIVEISTTEPHLTGDIELFLSVDDGEEATERQAMREIAWDVIDRYASLNPNFPKEVGNKLKATEDLSYLTDQMAFNMLTHLEGKQHLLEEVNITSRFKQLITYLNTEIQVMELKNDINAKVKKKIDKNQREYFLREQMKVIQEELGEEQEIDDELEAYRRRAEKLKAKKPVKERIDKELKRLKRMQANSSEGSVIRNYIENLLELPWDKKSKDSKDLKKAEQILDEDHYGLEKVKERVIEHLAVRQMTKKTDSPIICLVGPPGTGKTSIARSVARSLNRQYARISLGGVRDEADIRGHRKTYIGAMPGRIIAALKQAGTANPLILLDEVDKMTSDMRGNPAAALLEVLDGEQNNRFRDHYVELDVDLSDVLFIATANTLRTIPRPLMDRLEIIDITSYTSNEKVHIAKAHLIYKQMEKHGLKPEQIKFSDRAILEIIQGYTKEAGVRNLERRIGQICRKVAKEIVVANKQFVQMTEKNVKKYLGTVLFQYDMRSDAPQVGVVRGLAWTEVGGDTLSVEVNVMPGTGKFELTGQLGNVMKESAKAAISYTRAVAESVGIDEDFYKTKDIHIHIPQGAVPKDGPSAGITMATAIISALSGKKVHNKVAMTGEITLRGRVLPIGGLKEKLLAAKRAGIEKVLVPEDNRRHVEKISKEIIKGLEIIYVSEMAQVLEQALI